jgi:biotin carboxyl carrier protein
LNLLRAPMHGMVKSIACEAGDSVAEGTTIVVVEAMKMQNPLFAPMTGKVIRMCICSKGNGPRETRILHEGLASQHNNNM